MKLHGQNHAIEMNNWTIEKCNMQTSVSNVESTFHFVFVQWRGWMRGKENWQWIKIIAKTDANETGGI